MNLSPMSSLAVITGDIVGYTKLSHEQQNQVFEGLQAGVADLNEWPVLTGKVSLLDRSRGDGWQLALAQPAFSLRALLYLRACIRAKQVRGTRFETRAFLQIGPASHYDPADLTRSDGLAFTGSGRGVDEMRGTILFRGALGEDKLAYTPLVSALVVGTDALSHKWTARQAIVMQQILRPDPPDQTTIATTLKIKPPTVNAHLLSANGLAIINMLEGFEQFLSEK